MKYGRIWALAMSLFIFNPLVNVAQSTDSEDPDIKNYFKSDSTSFVVYDCGGKASKKQPLPCSVKKVYAFCNSTDLSANVKESYTANDRWQNYDKTVNLLYIDFWNYKIDEVLYNDQYLKPQKYYTLYLPCKDRKPNVRTKYESSILGKDDRSTDAITLYFHSKDQAEKVYRYLMERADRSKKRMEDKTATTPANAGSNNINKSNSTMDESWKNLAKAAEEYSKANGKEYKPNENYVLLSVLDLADYVKRQDLKGLMEYVKNKGLNFEKSRNYFEPRSKYSGKDSATVYESKEHIKISAGLFEPMQIRKFDNGLIEIEYPFHWSDLEAVKKEITAAGYTVEFSKVYSDANRELRIVVPESTNYSAPDVIIYKTR